MGLFGKKEACPVCGGEVKGLFNKKIADKKTLCKDCSNQVSMKKELLKTATPEYMREHLEYRKKNAVKFNALRWDVKLEARATKMGVDPSAGFLYLIDDEMDNSENPLVLSFDQIAHYELYRMKKRVDDSDTPGPTALESGLSVLSSIAKLANKDNRSLDYFRFVITTTDPYWPEIDIRINFDSPDDVHGVFGFGKDLQQMCQVLKAAVRKEQVVLF